ncbi:MAG: hypothetical protein F6K30_20120 [Cyanothece sp. SIO2G6]|nr:hypothetical protein [Cyanothece sp. SIO2G6]
MSNFEPVISACRYCRSYHLEGRRGGFCMQFGTPVQGCWKACSCAIPPFAPSWEVPASISGELTQLLWQRSQDPAAIMASGSTNVQGLEQPTIEVVGSCTSDPRSDTDAGFVLSRSKDNGHVGTKCPHDPPKVDTPDTDIDRTKIAVTEATVSVKAS